MSNNNIIYIQSLSASSIWESNHRSNRPLKEEKFKGAIPYSLESIKLQQSGFTTLKESKSRVISYDVVNVKFDGIVRDGKDILGDVPNWIERKQEAISKVSERIQKECKVKRKQQLEADLIKLHSELESLHNLRVELEKHSVNSNPIWDSVKTNDLRMDLYKNGFDLDIYDKKKKTYIKAHFVLYKRSTSKSRNGHAWFIREDLHKEMSAWSNMRLDFSKGNVDLIGLMAYESLVTSTIVDKITIDPDSILLIDKVVSKFNDKKVNVIELKDEMLTCVPKNHLIENELFDGSALLDSNLFVRGFRDRGFLQLRNTYFKCAAFNTDLQGFFKDYFGDEYETATVTDMFNNRIQVSKIKMVVNPSDLKCLKYNYAIGTKEDMWNRWKQFVRDENNSEFGVCKWEKATKRVDEDEKEAGIHYQQMSYQMINSLPSNYKQISNLAQFEIDYIKKLKNNPDKLMQYLERTKNTMNANEMFLDIYKVNKGIVETQIFRNFKKEVIRKYREQLQSGKIRVQGDYVTMGANLVEYLLATVGEVKGELLNSVVFKENEVFTTLFPAGELIGFRNPHVSPANLIRLVNVRPDLDSDQSNEYYKYFNYFKVTKNIAIVNSCHSLLNDTLNGCDFDGDSLMLSDDKCLLEIMNSIEGKYLAPVNAIPLKTDSKELNYLLNNESKAKVDNKGSIGQKRIGSITNLGQQACSIMWNELNELKPDMDKVNKLLDIVNSLAVCSGLAIDGAKREYKVNLGKQISHFRKVLNGMMIVHNSEFVNVETGELTKEETLVYPKFWKYVKEGRKDKLEKVIVETDGSKKQKESIYYNTPMDWLYYKMEHLPKGGGVKNPSELIDLLESGFRIKDGDRRKQHNIEELASESQNETNHIYAEGFNNDGEEEEVLREVESAMEKYDRKINKIKMDEKTMYALLAKISKRTEGHEDNLMSDGKPYPNLRIMLHLYKAYKPLFLQAFKSEAKNVHRVA